MRAHGLGAQVAVGEVEGWQAVDGAGLVDSTQDQRVALGADVVIEEANCARVCDVFGAAAEGVGGGGAADEVESWARLVVGDDVGVCGLWEGACESEEGCQCGEREEGCGKHLVSWMKHECRVGYGRDLEMTWFV